MDSLPRRYLHPISLALALAGLAPPAAAQPADAPLAIRHNAIIFVADGLRAGSVNAEDAPTLFALRSRGVSFPDSHALFPTFTTANASAIATGHQLGDTGDFSNVVYTGFPVFSATRAADVLGKSPGTVTPFLENDQVLADLDEHFAGGSFLGETSLLAAARAAGFRTAAIGKLGPVAIQDLAQVRVGATGFDMPAGVVIDDSTGRSDGAGSAQAAPLPDDVAAAMMAAGLGVVAPARTQPAGSLGTPGTHEANLAQQRWMVDATTRAVLPTFKASGKPFVLVYWSRDPDGSQHNQGDSLNRLDPGINGPTSRAGVANADANLKQILDFVAANPQLAASTDIFVTSDHGFATISKHEIDAQGATALSLATRFSYLGSDGKPEVQPGWLPPGFLAIELAALFDLPLFDPDTQVRPGIYRAVDPAGKLIGAAQRPASGNGVIGGSGDLARVGSEARLIVAANGGSDLVYVPDHDPRTVTRVLRYLLRQPYVGGLFVHSRYGRVPGALPLASIGLEGGAQMPVPDVVVGFLSFARDAADPLQSSILVADSALQEGQGMHGALSRACTLNAMVAFGPDFRQGYVDPLPVGNADIVPTLAQLLGIPLPSRGGLAGRVLAEALPGGADPIVAPAQSREVSVDPLSGRATVLEFQQLGAQRYLDRACLVELDEDMSESALRCP